MSRSQPATWVEIDSAAIAANYQALAQWVAPTPVMGVVKSNAYGHGIIEVARLLQEVGAPSLGVNSALEALHLRRNGITVPLVVFGYTEPELVANLVDHDVAISIFSKAQLGQIAQTLTATKKPLNVHLKVETGLGRLGFLPQELASIKLDKAKFQLEGIYSHFASVEEANLGYAQRQMSEFQAAIAQIKIPKNLTRHMASTAAALLLPEARFDLVRMGIGLYGLWPSEEVQKLVQQKFGKIPTLTPALGWQTRIVDLKRVPKGNFVGYGCSWQATRPTIVGVVPLGYNEGLPRRYATGKMLVRDQPSPIIGRICMNMTMLDVTDIKGATEGDLVTVIGGKTHPISVDAMAQELGTINYEVTTRIPAFVPRIYKGEQ